MKKYRYLTRKEEEQSIIEIMDVLLDSSVPFSGAHRKKQWEKGWSENAKSGNITPRYFGKYLVQRLNGRLIVAKDKDYEVNKLHELVLNMATKYFKKSKEIWEFGCGTGHNLVAIKQVLPQAIMVGADWTRSSQKIVNNLGHDFAGVNFDYFNPPRSTKLVSGAGIITVASLEQTGTGYKKFVSWLLKNKPAVVVHIEPIPELLDSTVLLDYLSIKYMEKRKYLSGYLDYLRSLEKKGKLKILEARRSGIGSFLIDGYSIVAWKPI